MTHLCSDSRLYRLFVSKENKTNSRELLIWGEADNFFVTMQSLQIWLGNCLRAFDVVTWERNMSMSANHDTEITKQTTNEF